MLARALFTAQPRQGRSNELAKRQERATLAREIADEWQKDFAR